MLMKAGEALARKYDLGALRFAASVGEPLNPEAVVWGANVLGHPFHDNWWQTETGGIMISNFASMEIRPGSMGRPLPGIEAALVKRTLHLVALDETIAQQSVAMGAIVVGGIGLAFDAEQGNAAPLHLHANTSAFEQIGFGGHGRPCCRHVNLKSGK